MIIGKLDKVIEIRQKTTSKDLSGEDVDNYDTVFATVFAHWKPRRGTEGFEAGQLVAVGVGELEIRRLPGIDETMKVVMDDVWYDILNVMDIGREGHSLEVKKKDNEG